MSRRLSPLASEPSHPSSARPPRRPFSLPIACGRRCGGQIQAIRAARSSADARPSSSAGAPPLCGRPGRADLLCCPPAFSLSPAPCCVLPIRNRTCAYAMHSLRRDHRPRRCARSGRRLRPMPRTPVSKSRRTSSSPSQSRPLFILGAKMRN